MFVQRIFQGTSDNSVPFLILKATSPRRPEEAIFSPVLIGNCTGAAAPLSIAGWDEGMNWNCFLEEQTGNVIENKGPA